VSLTIVPIDFDEANALVAQWHRHHKPTVGHKFSLGVAVPNSDRIPGLKIVGAAIVGRPVARGLDDGWTLEVLRCVTDGTKNACSALYAASWRVARALGYRKLVTYVLASESGVSVRAAGWKQVGTVTGRSWNVPSRPRVDKHPTVPKLRFEVSA
jgi:hypothetical protein